MSGVRRIFGLEWLYVSFWCVKHAIGVELVIWRLSIMLDWDR